MQQISEFIITKEYKRFTEFCNACKQEKYIGLCYGPAGVGKSMAAYNFARWHDVIREFEIKAKIQSWMDYPGPTINVAELDTILYTPEVCNTPRSVDADITDLIYKFNILIEKGIFKNQEIPFEERVKCRVNLLIIDEAERLQPKSLELVRDIYDRKQIAVILIGMPGIEKRLIRFPQLYSRIGFSHMYKPLIEQEVTFIIQNHMQSLGIAFYPKDFSDQEAIATVTRVTQGNFRLIQRLLKQASRIMVVNKLSSITKEVIEAARECLVIGNLY